MYDTYYLPGTIAITIKKDRTIPSAVTDGRQRIRSRPHVISRGACVVLPLHDVQHLSRAGATTTKTTQLRAGPLDLIQATFADSRIRVYGRETALDLLDVSSPYIFSSTSYCVQLVWL
jgi:hypothetical protein